jgi:hypothetical protein
MSSRFDWETEEEFLWQDQQNGGKRVRWPSKRSLLIAFFILAIVAGGITLILHRIDQQAAEISATVAEDILASQQVWQTSISDTDVELFESVLSGSRPNWMDTQYELFDAKLLLDRWTLGLVSIGNPEVTDITVSPDLTEAEVLLEQNYSPTAVSSPVAQQNLSGLSEAKQNTITLKQVLTFRRGQEQWLYSAPQQIFWGNWKMAQSHYLTVSYPERDEELAKRLLDDLDEDVAAMCTTLPEVDCTPDLHLHVRLETDPRSLVETADPAIMLGPVTTLGLSLPAPSLVGIPSNEESYQALRRGYSVHVISAAITTSVEYTCCTNGLLYQALLDKQLSVLGLRLWPLGIPEYQTAFNNSPIGIVDMQQLWRSKPDPHPTDPATLPIYALVDYLTGIALDHSITSMQRGLSTTDSLQAWLLQYFPTSNHLTAGIQHDWLHHIADYYAQKPAPLPPPAQDIKLLCNNERGDNATLLRFDPATDVWTAELSDRSFVFMNPLPDDNGLLLQERQDQPEQSRVLLWQNGLETDVFGQTVAEELFRTIPGGQGLILFIFEDSFGWTLFRLKSSYLCDSIGCIIRTLFSPPIWSTDGNRSIVRTGKQTLWLADATGRDQTFLGTGIAPFWLDEDTAGYLQTGGREPDAKSNIVLTTISTLQTENLLPVEAPASLLPESIEERKIAIRTIKTSPAHPDLLLIAAAILDEEQLSDSGGLIFSFDMQDEKIRLLLNLPYNLRPYDEFSFSPDGEWLTVKSTDRSGIMSQLHLQHLASDQTIVLNSTYPSGYPGYDWSADSQWLLRTEARFLHLYAPAFGYQRLVVHEYPGCNFAAWINK